MDLPIVLINHPVKGIRIEGRSGRFEGLAISETKDCAACQHLKAITSSKKTGYRISEERMLKITGVCAWSDHWKIVWPSNKPKKCVKLSAFFEKQFKELV